MTAMADYDDLLAAATLIRDRLAKLSGEHRIPLPVHGFGEDELGVFLPDDAGNPVPGRWCTVYRERGQDEVREVVDSEDELLYTLFEHMLSTAATGWEARHRIPHQDSRRRWFAKQTQWTAAYWPQWLGRLAAHQEEILETAPFDDASTQFAEFVAALELEERKVVWRLRGRRERKVRQVVLDLVRESGRLPSRGEVEERSGVSLRR